MIRSNSQQLARLSGVRTSGVVIVSHQQIEKVLGRDFAPGKVLPKTISIGDINIYVSRTAEGNYRLLVEDTRKR